MSTHLPDNRWPQPSPSPAGKLQARINRLTREIDRLKQSEQDLREKSDFLNTLLETISNPVFYKDVNGRYTGCNRAFEDFIGRPRTDIIGKTVYDLAPEDNANRYHEKDAELFQRPGTQRYEWRVRRYDGDLRDVIFEKAAIMDAGDNVIGLVGVISDITEHKRAEEALQEREATLQAILSASPVGIFLAHNRILGWTNQAMNRIWGYEDGSLLGKSTRILYPDDDEYERVGHRFYSEIENFGLASIETRWVTRQNEQIHCYLQGCPLDPADPTRGVIVVAIDITERKRIEEQVKQLKEKYEDLYHNAPTMYLSLDPRGIIVECNNTILDTLGYARDAFMGRPMAEFLTETSVAKMKEDFRILLDRGKLMGVDRQLVARDGLIIDVILSVTMEYDGRGNPKKSRAVFEDISKRKRAEGLVHNLTQMLMQAQEHERKMISYELHDCIAQNLSLLKINYDTIFSHQPAISGPMKSKMETHSRLIEQTIQTVRDLSYGLSPPGIDEIGIVSTLSHYCEEFSRKSGLAIQFFPVDMEGVKPDQKTTINLYRIVQESLNNAWKHAGARHITVQLTAAAPDIRLQIEDDGHGFDVPSREHALAGEQRMGLRIMRERTSLLNGRLEIRSDPARGTRISVTCPLVETRGRRGKSGHECR
ncbi:PAS domain-containing sensor histidine kinase [Desulfosarcina alkanivorans]|uniref:PAS domain-containing sensor histidine kinase n=1 Tax=Desulfosarcina alkanivorans TaxID=571177 RepID=UPI0012D2D97B|nr:PAS domain S-box protein [Desulfosarcina alkanivorans]